MAWCPVCKNEYRAGIKVCPDCNTELVDELKENDDQISVLQCDNEALMTKIVNYLNYCGISTEKKSETVEEEGENGEKHLVTLYSLFVPKSKAKEASKEIRTVLSVEAKNDGPTSLFQKTAAADGSKGRTNQSSDSSPDIPSGDSSDALSNTSSKTLSDAVSSASPDTLSNGTEQEGDAGGNSGNSDSQDELGNADGTGTSDAKGSNSGILGRAGGQSSPHSAGVFVDAKERYKEYRSSGTMLLAFGALALAFFILSLTGVVSIFSNTLSLVLLCVISLVLIGGGISSFVRSKSLLAEASDEEKQTEQINSLLHDKFSKETLRDMAEPDESPELLYLKLTDAMREAVLAEYPNTDETFLDALIEEYYNSLEEK